MVSLIGSRDRQLEDILRSVAGQVTALSNLNALGSSKGSGDEQQVVVIDIRDQPGVPAALAAVRRAHPLMGIIMVASHLDPATMLEAMRSGVNEFLTEPVTMDDVRAAVQRVSTLTPVAKRGTTYAFLGAKGGVGATTVAVNVATMLNKLRPASTLLIDLHSTYGDAAIFLGAEPRFSIADALENMHRMDATFLRGLVTQTKSGVHLLASSDRPAKVPADVAHVRRLLALAATEFSYVVLDVPRSDVAILDALEEASAIVVVANQELATVRSAGRMASSMEQRYGKERVSVVMTRYDDGAEIVRQDVERVVGRRVGHLFPNNYQIALASQNKGRPLVLDNHSTLASALTRFTRSLANLPAEGAEQQKSSGLLSMIRGRRQ